MSKQIDIVFNEKFVTLIDKNSAKAEPQKINLIDADTPDVAVNVMKKEINGRTNVTKAALSILVNVYDTQRLAAYRGKTPLGGKLPPELKNAVRDAENDYLRPIFEETLSKSTDEESRQLAWDQFIGNLRAGGIYAMVKNKSLRFFAYMGKLPCVYHGSKADKAHLLPVNVMDTMIAQQMAGIPKDPQDNSFAHKIEALNVLLTKPETVSKMDEADIERAILAVSETLTMLKALKEENAKADEAQAAELGEHATTKAKAKAQEPALV